MSVAGVLWMFHGAFLSAVSGVLAAVVTAAGAGVAAGVLHSLSDGERPQAERSC